MDGRPRVGSFGDYDSAWIGACEGERAAFAGCKHVAGASGTIGIPLVRALVAAGHQVTALTRSPGKQSELRAVGATPVVADALDREALIAAVVAARPTHVIHKLTALPKDGTVRGPKDLEATNRLRIEGTRNLIDAAIQAGARRFLVGSFALLSPRGPVGAESENEAAAAVRSMETQVMEATKRGSIEGVVLRYGMFYGLHDADGSLQRKSQSGAGLDAKVFDDARRFSRHVFSRRLGMDQDVFNTDRPLLFSIAYRMLGSASEPALVIRVAKHLESIFVFSVEDGLITGIRVVRNPDKLAHIDRKLKTAADYADYAD